MVSNANRARAVGAKSDTVVRRSLLLNPAEIAVLLRMAARATAQATGEIENVAVGSELFVLAQRIHQRRRDRQQHFSSELFGEPAWDMLLAAYWLPKTGVELNVLGLCNEAGASKTTAWRALERLIRLGLIETRNGKDRRSTRVMLTSEARDKIEDYLRGIAASNEALAEFA